MASLRADMPSIEDLPKQSSYEILKPIDRGCWTAVYLAKRRVDGSLWALKFFDPTEIAKRQMVDRGLDLDQMWEKESLQGHNRGHTNIAHNLVEIAEDGSRFLAEEYVETFLPQWLRKHPNASLEDRLNIIRGLATGLSVLHRDVRRVHADLKLDNVGYHDGVVKISDFGATTVLNRIVSPARDNIGEIATRAYECFQEGSHPSTESDVWALGSITYKILTGAYIFEEELDNAKDKSAFMATLDSTVANVMVGSKLSSTQVPKPLRRFLQKSLSFYPHDRYADGSEALVAFENALDHLQTGKYFRKKILPNATIFLAGATLLGGWLYKASTYEPEKLTLPRVIMTGPVSHPASDHFLSEQVTFFHDSRIAKMAVPPVDIDEQDVKGAVAGISGNRNTAFLFKAYLQALNYCSLHCPVDDHTSAQWTVFSQWNMGNGHVASASSSTSSIIINIDNSVANEGNVFPSSRSLNLENVLFVSRLGWEKYERARRISGSFDFETYVDATFAGERIVPLAEKEFLLAWRSYVLEGTPEKLYVTFGASDLTPREHREVQRRLGSIRSE